MSKEKLEKENGSVDNYKTLFDLAGYYVIGALVAAVIFFGYGIANDNAFGGLINAALIIVSIFLVVPLLENKAFVLKNLHEINEQLKNKK